MGILHDVTSGVIPCIGILGLLGWNPNAACFCWCFWGARSLSLSLSLSCIYIYMCIDIYVNVYIYIHTDLCIWGPLRCWQWVRIVRCRVSAKKHGSQDSGCSGKPRGHGSQIYSLRRAARNLLQGTLCYIHP